MLSVAAHHKHTESPADKVHHDAHNRAVNHGFGMVGKQRLQYGNAEKSDVSERRRNGRHARRPVDFISFYVDKETDAHYQHLHERRNKQKYADVYQDFPVALRLLETVYRQRGAAHVQKEHRKTFDVFFFQHVCLCQEKTGQAQRDEHKRV